MVILYVGNFSQTHCTEFHLALTLEDLGHRVIRAQENTLNHAQLRNHIDERPDLFLYTRTWGTLVNDQHLTQLRNLGIPSASYHLDLYVGLKRESGLNTDPFWKTDYVFTPDGSEMAAEVFKRHGINHHYIKPGVYKDECVYGTPKNEFKSDLVFVGGGSSYMHPEYPYRQQLLAWLGTVYGDRYKKWGYPEPTVRNQALNNLYASAKIVIGDSLCLNFDHPYYWSDRVYETLGRGGFIIHPFIEGMQEEFTDGETVVFYKYNDWVGLKDKIDYYLEHDAERIKIRDAGHAFVKENATYHNRMNQMLEVING